jgi:hypothetical protein
MFCRSSFFLFLLAIVLCVLMSFFFWPLCCVSLCPFSFGHCVVCPYVLFLLAIVLCVLLRFTDSYYSFGIFKLFSFQRLFILFGLPIVQLSAYLMKVILKTRRTYYIWYLRFYYYHWGDTSAGGLLVPDDIIRPVVSASIIGEILLLVDY